MSQPVERRPLRHSYALPIRHRRQVLAIAQTQVLDREPSSTDLAQARRPARAPAPRTSALPSGTGQLLLPGLDLAETMAPRAALMAVRPEAVPRAALANYPDVAAADLCRHAKRLGKAAELLVDSLLMRLGERVFSSDEHEPFDRILWLPQGPLRLQVKSRHRCRAGQWLFTITKGYRRGPNGTRPYDADDYDMLALVILPESAVCFVPRGLHRHCIPQAAVARLRTRPRDSLDAALRALGHAAAIPPRTAAA